jgi:hypothetical protein
MAAEICSGVPTARIAIPERGPTPETEIRSSKRDKDEAAENP